MQPCSGTAAEMTLPSLHSLLCVCLRADQAAGDQLQAGQGDSEGPAGAQGLGVCTFLYSSSSPPAQVSSSCHEGEEPQRQGSEKTGFYSSCAAHSHSLETLSCQSYYETNQVPDSGLALPHPQESQHCTKLYLQGKQSEMASPKKPPCNSEENVQDKCDSYTLHTASFPLAAPWTSVSPEQLTTGY